MKVSQCAPRVVVAGQLPAERIPMKRATLAHACVQLYKAGACLLVTGGVFISAQPVQACGYEDPQSIAMGTLNFAYPDALHVGTAIWQAQVEGVLPRPIRQAPTATRTVVSSSRDPSTVAALNEKLQLMAEARAASRVIDEMRSRLAKAISAERRLPFAVVFASRMFWSRFLGGASGLISQTHVAGPEPGDVVLVTEALVLEAILAQRITLDEAFARGILRIYGDKVAAQAARDWLASLQATSERTN